MKKIILLSFLILGTINTVFGQQKNSNSERLMMQGQTALQWGYYDKASEYFRKATLAEPKNAEAFYYWGVALTAIAEEEQDEKIYKESFDKYKKATQLDPDMALAYNDWACGLMRLGKMKNKIKQYSAEAEKYLKRAEVLGEQMAAYNLGCLFSILNKKEKAIEWLNTMMKKDYKEKMPDIGREMFNSDEDFDNIRQSDEFIQFLNSSFPNDLPEKFQII